MNFKTRIGLNIQNIRHSRGLSQEQLALAAQIDRSYISEIELAKSSVSADKLEQIAHTLGIDPSELCKQRGLTMVEVENPRLSADPIGKINCIKTSDEIGILYKWDNGETQVALFSDWDIEQAVTEIEGDI